MAKCPYCENEMKKGFVEGDERDDLIWVEGIKKRNIIQKITNDNCIIKTKYIS